MVKGLLSWWKGATPGRSRHALGPRGRLRGNPLMKAEEMSLGPSLPPGCPPAPGTCCIRSPESTAKSTEKLQSLWERGYHGALLTGGNPCRTGEPMLPCKWPCPTRLGRETCGLTVVLAAVTGDLAQQTE